MLSWILVIALGMSSVNVRAAERLISCRAKASSPEALTQEAGYLDLFDIEFKHRLAGAGKARLFFRRLFAANEEEKSPRFEDEGSLAYDKQAGKLRGLWKDKTGSASLELSSGQSDNIPREDVVYPWDGILTLKSKQGAAQKQWQLQCWAGLALPGNPAKPSFGGACYLYTLRPGDPWYGCRKPHNHEERRWVHSADGRPYYYSPAFPSPDSVEKAKTAYGQFGRDGGLFYFVGSTNVCQDLAHQWHFLVQYQVERTICY